MIQAQEIAPRRATPRCLTPGCIKRRVRNARRISIDMLPPPLFPPASIGLSVEVAVEVKVEFEAEDEVAGVAGEAAITVTGSTISLSCVTSSGSVALTEIIRLDCPVLTAVAVKATELASPGASSFRLHKTLIPSSVHSALD